MTKPKKLPPPPDTKKAIHFLQGFFDSKEQEDQEKETDTLINVARKALELADDDFTKCKNRKEFLTVLAAQQAALAILAEAEGRDRSGALKAFDEFVENHLGGPRSFDLGQRPIKHKKTAKQYYLRAAAVVIWKEHPELQDRLTSEAKKYLGVNSKRALAKIVDHHDQGHLNPEKPSQLSQL